MSVCLNRFNLICAEPFYRPSGIIEMVRIFWLKLVTRNDGGHSDPPVFRVEATTETRFEYPDGRSCGGKNRRKYISKQLCRKLK